MCGIAGILKKGSGDYPVGQALLTMAQCLQHRGMDSAGIAVFETVSEQSPLRIQIMLPEGNALPEPQALQALGKGFLFDLKPEASGFMASLRPGVIDEAGLIDTLEEILPGSTVSAFGVSMTIEKVVGLADALAARAAGLKGTHGVAHLRLATESRIDPAHAQPFWGRPYQDIAVTHNGHITNYYKMRQRFETEGHRFASRNDSEIIGVYLGRKLAQGMDLEAALQDAGRDLDGSYSLIAATRQGIGVVRDPFATKPLLYAETEDVVALASEPQGLHRLLGEAIMIKEIKPREVRVWEKA
jgi:glutamine phosphoribosylpyrophosphate amidotransferase